MRKALMVAMATRRVRTLWEATAARVWMGLVEKGFNVKVGAFLSTSLRHHYGYLSHFIHDQIVQKTNTELLGSTK